MKIKKFDKYNKEINISENLDNEVSKLENLKREVKILLEKVDENITELWSSNLEDTVSCIILNEEEIGKDTPTKYEGISKQLDILENMIKNI